MKPTAKSPTPLWTLSRWRVAVVLILIGVPILALMSAGSYYLWQTGQFVYLWWPMAGCLAAGYFLAWYWLRKKQLLPPVETPPPLHWTARDHEAWKLVEARADDLAQREQTDLNELQFYAVLGQDMAQELARFYHPHSKDPIGALTVPEVLAVVELASHDLADLVEKNVPGGHLMSIDQWRWAHETATKATKMYQTASNAYWLGAILLDPISSGLRYAATKAGMTRPLTLFQQDLVSWFHAAYVRRLGHYLIDLYSGRLKVGANRYRELQQTLEPTPEAEVVGETRPVALTVFGQAKMGKSSFVNALLGEEKSRTDVVPVPGQTRYVLKRDDLNLLVIDTPGYGQAGPKDDQVEATVRAAQESDLLILVLHARNPARQADLEMLERLSKWFAQHPELKMPPVLAVLTHIDLLSPAMEWSPPYQWQEPKRPKEVQIHEALRATREPLGQYLTGILPACTAAGKVYGLEEWVVPAIVEQLGEAKGVSLLRLIKSEADARKIRKVFHQIAAVGKQALDVWLSGRR